MSFLRNLLTKIRPVFTPLERQLLSAVEAALPGGAAETFRRQVESINLVQRHGGSREVNCYPMAGGRPRRDPALLFPDRSRERELARARFRVPAQGAKIRQASFFLVEGYFFSIVFDAPVETLQNEEAEIVEVRILADPMQPAGPFASAPMQGPPRFEGWLGEWVLRYPLSQVLQPLQPQDRQKRIEEIPARLPVDYLAMTEQTDGFLLGNAKVFGLAETYPISLDDRDYQVLAEVGGRGVVAVESRGKGRIWFLDYDQEVPPAEAGTFREGVEAFLQDSVAPGGRA